jgi:hypothetical protein
LHKILKLRVLGLALLAHTIARQRSQLLFLVEGNANTRFYHLQACHRSRKSRIDSFQVQGTKVVSDMAMAAALYDHFNEVLGSNFERSRRFDMHAIDVPTIDLSTLEHVFTEEEVRAVIMDLPNDKVLGPDDFMRLFYKMTWETIKVDVMNAFIAFWSQDSRSFNHLNDAYMILLKKKEHPAKIHDYRPISLIHSFSKLVTKCLARRLATVLDVLVSCNQSAFIKGR